MAVGLAAERIREELQTEPQSLLEQLEVDPQKMPPAEQVEAEVARLRRQRDALGCGQPAGGRRFSRSAHGI